MEWVCIFFCDCGSFLIKKEGWHGASPATPAAEGVPHGGMGGARTDGGGLVTGPIHKRKIVITEKKMLPWNEDEGFGFSQIMPLDP